MGATSLRPLDRGFAHKVWLALALLALFFAAASPSVAHEEHKKKERAEAAQIVQHGKPSAPAATQGDPAAMGEMMEEPAEDRSKMSALERLMDWFGRLHPVIVHFPIAFFPAALFTAIVGRRRSAFAAPVQFLVIAGGIIGPIAALLGWFDGGFDVATDDWLLQWHRWLGTAIGVGALGLGIWAWRKPDDNRGTGMIVGLSIITAAIIAQGWFGGAMVHGMDHMNW